MSVSENLQYMIVGKSKLIRAGVRTILKDNKNGAQTFYEAEDMAEAVEMLRDRPSVNIVISEIESHCRLPAEFNIWRESFPDLPVVIVAERFDPDTVACGRDVGIRGFVPLCAEGEVLVGAIDLALAGGIFIPEEILDYLRCSRALQSCVAEVTLSDIPVLGTLTPRQREVLALLSTGKSNKEICRDLGLSVGTVKNHVATILRQLSVRNRAQAVSFYGAAIRDVSAAEMKRKLVQQDECLGLS